MKRMLILTVVIPWLCVSATAHAQVAVAVRCPFGVTLSADLTGFGCASDPLGAPIYQFPSGVGAPTPTIAPLPGIGASAPNAGGAGGVSHRERAVWARYRQQPATPVQSISLAAAADANAKTRGCVLVIWRPLRSDSDLLWCRLGK